jgi:hypothetical protein
VDTIAAGDTIIVKPGTYVGARITKSGSPGAPKTLQSESKWAAVLNSSGSAERHNGILELEDWDGTGPIKY